MTNKPIRQYDTFGTNIKGLPEGEYMTQTLWSDTNAWKVIEKSPSGKTITLQAVETERDPDWKPEFVAGGFAGHCTNQADQTWLYKGLAPYTKKVRLVKSRYHGSDKLWGCRGAEFIANGAYRKHDYNF